MNKNIFKDELPSYKFLADKHSSLTMYDIDNISFELWCKNKNIWYEGWCNDTCYWSPFDKSHSPGFLFFDLNDNIDFWIHGFGHSKKEILCWIYSETEYHKRFPNSELDDFFRKEPYDSFRNYAYNCYITNVKTP